MSKPRRLDLNENLKSHKESRSFMNMRLMTELHGLGLTTAKAAKTTDTARRALKAFPSCYSLL
jgi:hypothetical protein